jgi:hypothetical protein
MILFALKVASLVFPIFLRRVIKVFLSFGDCRAGKYNILNKEAKCSRCFLSSLEPRPLPKT